MQEIKTEVIRRQEVSIYKFNVKLRYNARKEKKRKDQKKPMSGEACVDDSSMGATGKMEK